MKVTCNDQEWMCDSGDKCIHMGWLCDGYVDCPDGSDEEYCSNTNNTLNGLGNLLARFIILLGVYGFGFQIAAS